jgi:hypothetical protein
MTNIGPDIDGIKKLVTPITIEITEIGCRYFDL